jgi:acetylornithine deacetylase
LRCHLTYLPDHADRDGYGTHVQAEFTDWILRAAAADSWLAGHPPEITWGVDVPPAQVPAGHPVVEALAGGMAALGRQARPIGTGYWNDGATFTRAGTPAVTFGPGAVTVAHTVDEYVALDELADCAKGLALAALRFCAGDRSPRG